MRSYEMSLVPVLHQLNGENKNHGSVVIKIINYTTMQSCNQN